MPKNKFLLPFLIFSSIIFTACNLSSTNREIPQPPVIPESITPNNPPMEIQPTTEAAQQVIQANNQFALDLYQRYSSNPDNLFFSPYSMSTAIAMSYEGARGNTAEEMRKTFHFPENIETLQQGSAALNSQINQPNQDFQLSTANALWAEKTYPFAQEYLDNAKKYYQGEITNLDFINNANTSRIFINDWVAKKTNDKITNLIPENSIDAMTRLVLTNAVYFKGDWIKQFDTEQTTDAEFQINANDSTTVKLMRQINEEAVFNYAESEEMQIIELPYSGDQLSMLVILPKKTGDLYDLAGLEKNFTLDQLNNWKNALQMKRVFLYLPKFKLETTYQMAEDLIALGMVEAFSPDADFSGMTGFKDLNISAVIHKAFVEVNEEGTEAAAATAIIQRAGSAYNPNAPVIPTFRADHPFIFIIQQKENGNILFIGRVSNPPE